MKLLILQKVSFVYKVCYILDIFSVKNLFINIINKSFICSIYL